MAEAQRSAVNAKVAVHAGNLIAESGSRQVTEGALRSAQKAKALHSRPRNNVDLFGWDAVWAVTFETMNGLIARQVAQASWPKTLHQITHKSEPPVLSVGTAASGKQREAELEGELGTWKLALDGDGDDIFLNVEIKKATLRYYSPFAAAGAAPDVTEIKQCVAQISVKAEFLADTANNAATELRIKTGDAIKLEQVAPSLGNVLKDAALKVALSAWFQDNSNKFNLLFATVQQMANTGSRLDWMKPSHLGYAVNVPRQATEKTATFAILAMINGAEPGSRSTFEVSQDVIVPGSDMGFSLSRAAYLRYFLLPAVPAMFQGAIAAQPAENNFKLNDDATEITNIVEATTVEMKTDDGHSFALTIPKEKFRLSVEGDKLTVRINDARFGDVKGYTLKLDFDETFKFGFAPARGKTPAHIVVKEVDANSDVSVEEEQWYANTQIALDIAGVVVTLTAIAMGFTFFGDGDSTAATEGEAAPGSRRMNLRANSTFAELDGEQMPAIADEETQGTARGALPGDGAGAAGGPRGAGVGHVLEDDDTDDERQSVDSSGSAIQYYNHDTGNLYRTREAYEASLKRTGVGDSDTEQGPPATTDQAGGAPRSFVRNIFKFVVTPAAGLLSAGLDITGFLASARDRHINQSYGNEDFKALEAVQHAISQAVNWPNTVGDFSLDAVALNDALQFGFSGPSAKAVDGRSTKAAHGSRRAQEARRAASRSEQ